MNALATAASTDPPVAGQIAAGIGVFLLYWLPSVIGGIRRVRGLGSVIVVNLFLGWTVIGWVVALAMACRSRKPAPVTPVSG